MTTKTIWLDGELVNWDDATVHVTTFGLHYGIGFFEGIRCVSGPDAPSIFRLIDHLRRLRRSATIYGFDLPYAVDELATACRTVVVANHLTDCYLRPIVFLGEGADPFAAALRAAVIATPHGPLAGAPKHAGAAAQISSFRRMSANSLPPAAKATGQYLNSFLAQAEANRTSSGEAILLNGDGFVADGWAHNVFAVQDGTIATPPLSAGALAGITRDTVLTLAREAGYQVRERNLLRSDLYLARECFLTGTATGMVPITSVDGRPVGEAEVGPVTARLMALLSDVMHGDSAAHPEWRDSVA